MRKIAILAVLISGIATRAEAREGMKPPGERKRETAAVTAHIDVRAGSRGGLMLDVQSFDHGTSFAGTKHHAAVVGARRRVTSRTWVQAGGGVARTSHRMEIGLPTGGAMPAFLVGCGVQVGAHAELALNAWSGLSTGGPARSLHVVGLSFSGKL